MASAPTVVLKFVIRSLSWTSRLASAREDLLLARRSAWTGRGPPCRAWPGSRSLRRAAPRARSRASRSAPRPPVSPFTSGSWSSSSPGCGWPLSESPKPASRSWRSLRVFVLSVPSTWSNCTGAAVWVAGIVSPSSMVSALGEPGLMSMKRLPSRKIRSPRLHLGVLVDRKRLVLELHRHLHAGRVVARAAPPWTPCPRPRRRSAPRCPSGSAGRSRTPPRSGTAW